MSRIEKVPVEQWDPELRAMTRADSGTPLEQGIMRMMAHVPDLAKGMIQFAGALKMKRGLPDRMVELVRLRVAFHNQCRSCMAIRYTDAVADGVTEGLVCQLAAPDLGDGLTPAEKAAIRFADKFANDHLSIDDAVYNDLRQYFTEAEIVELGMTVAFFVGFGRLAATWHMVEELPERFQTVAETISPWNEERIVVR